MNQAIDINNRKSEPDSATSTTRSKKGIIGVVSEAVNTRLEARKNSKAIREAKEISDKIRKGKDPGKSFEQAIKEL